MRVVTDDGHLCPVRILRLGPGDAMEILFKLAPFQQKYAVYWGNANPPPLPAQAAAGFPIHYGLLLEMRGENGGGLNSVGQLQRAWENGSPDYGSTMIDRPFIGYNPITDNRRTISRITGSLMVPADGDYKFAGACASKGSLSIDGRPILFIPGCPGDIRFNATIHLTAGRHDFMMYHASNGERWIISLGWGKPDAKKVEIVDREHFGICARGMPGPLQQLRHDLTADFTSQNVAECFEHDPTNDDPEKGNYSQLFRFTAVAPPANPAMKIEWDFGDGQTASGPTIDHAFMTPGVYPVRLTYRIGSSSESQTNRILIGRDLTQPDQPQTNDPPVQSRIVAKYDVSTMPTGWLPWATILHSKAQDQAAMFATASRLASTPQHGDSNLAYQALLDLTKNAGSDAAAIARLWGMAPRESDLQPRAVKMQADVLLWDQGDFNTAQAVLAPFANSSDVGVKRRYAQATLLAGHGDDARKIFAQLASDDANGRAAAISGAMARTVEFYITESNFEAGIDAWDKWQSQYPADFVEGYGVVLRVKLMKLAGHPRAAADIAEAFAKAVPHSSYSPTLLDLASKLLAKIDPTRSAALRATLKDRYPEDPLSQ